MTDALTNQPLQAATVKLIPSNVTTNTGIDGKYLFKSLAPGNYQIQVSKQNYAEVNNSAHCNFCKYYYVDFELDEIPVIHYSTTVLDFGFSLTSLSFAISKTGPGEVAYIVNQTRNGSTVNPRSGNVDNEADSIIVTINRTGLTKRELMNGSQIISTYLQYDFLDTINVKVKVHDPIVFNPDLTYGSVSDIEGNVYKTIQIGSQIWMAENLKTTDTMIIQQYPWSIQFSMGKIDNTWLLLVLIMMKTYKDIHGALYNWFAVSYRKAMSLVGMFQPMRNGHI